MNSFLDTRVNQRDHNPWVEVVMDTINKLSDRMVKRCAPLVVHKVSSSSLCFTLFTRVVFLKTDPLGLCITILQEVTIRQIKFVWNSLLEIKIHIGQKVTVNLVYLNTGWKCFSCSTSHLLYHFLLFFGQNFSIWIPFPMSHGWIVGRGFGDVIKSFEILRFPPLCWYLETVHLTTSGRSFSGAQLGFLIAIVALEQHLQYSHVCAQQLHSATPGMVGYIYQMERYSDVFVLSTLQGIAGYHCNLP